MQHLVLTPPCPKRGTGLRRLVVTLLSLTALVASLLPTAAQGQTKPTVSSIDLIAGKFDYNAYAGPHYKQACNEPECTIWIAVTFSEEIDFRNSGASAAKPTLSLMIGDQTRETSINYLYSANQLIFGYKVAAGDEGRVRVGANALRDNGNTLYRRSGSADNTGDHADLSHAPMDLGHRVGGPTRVTNLKAESAGDGRLKVTWTAATYAPRGYRLFYRENKEGGRQEKWASSVSGTVITGLTNGQGYTIRVDTLDDDGNALDSTAVYTTGTPGGPTKVADLKASPGNGQLTVTWTAATSAPRGYRLFYRDRGTNIQKRWSSAESGTVITGLKNGQEYTIRVDTPNYDGRNLHHSRTAVYASGTPGVPTQVTDLKAAPGNGQLTVTWAAATYAPRGYRLFYRENKEGGRLLRWTPAVSGAVITGLTNAQEYEIRVDTLDAGGNAVDSTALTAVGTPDGPPTRVTDLSVEATASGELNVSWTAATYAPNGYRLRWRKTNGGFNEGQKLAVDTVSHKITGLEDDTIYRVRIDSLNADDSLGSGTAAAKDGRTRSGAAPRRLTLAAGTAAGSIDVSWTAATSAPNNGYRVRWRQSGATELSVGEVVPSGAGTSYTITGLAAGKKYIVRVDTLDRVGNIVARASASVSLKLAGNPQAPTITDIKLIAGQFDGAAYAGGPYNTGDTIWVSVNFSEDVAIRSISGSRPTLTLIIGNRERKATEQGLYDGTELRFRYKVAAQDAGPVRVKADSLRDNGSTIYRRGNGNGNGNAEVDQAVLTHDGVDTRSRVGRISRVRGLEAVAGDGSLGVSWTAEADAPHGYLVRWREREEGSSLSAGETESGTHRTITGLENGKAYVVRVDKLDADGNVVRATNSAVAGTPAEAGAPTRPRNLRLAPGALAGTIDVSWDAALTAPNGYLVRWRESGATELNAGLGVPSGTAHRIAGLEVGKQYIVRVDTRDRDGNAVAGVLASASAPAPDVPAEIVVHDAQGDEGNFIDFPVELSKSSTREVRVRWRTEPGTARAGKDYESGNGELVFTPGIKRQTIRVQTLDDTHDDSGETFRVLLSNVRGAELRSDRGAIGTIRNDDPMPAGWLARFGRAAAEQVLDGIALRIAAPRTPGRQGTLAGRPVGGAAPDGAINIHPGAPSAFGGSVGGFTGGYGNGMGGVPPHAHGGRGMAFGELLAVSSFALVGKADGSGRSAALWGRGARSSFHGMDGVASMDGTLTSATLGADYGGGRWLAGLALSRTVGEGGYRQPGAGAGWIRATLGTAVPYASVNASERLKLWAAAGGGSGALTLMPEGGAAAETGINWRMAAAGLRGDLFAGGSGLALAFVLDALWSRTASDRVEASGAATSLTASSSATSRLRLGLEGSWALPFGLTPKLEAGVRRDGGDAGSGFGVELGGGLAWNAPQFGLSLDLSGRTLLASGAVAEGDSGFSAALSYDPGPASPRGLSLTLRQHLGGSSTGGLAALFASDLSSGGFGGGQSRWTTEVAYGLPAFSGRFTASPTVGYGGFNGGRDYSLGWSLEPAADAENAPDLSLGLRATRRESIGAPADHGIEVEVRARW